MEKNRNAEQLVANRFQEEIESIGECKYCHKRWLMGGITSPQPDGRNRLIYCLNHKGGGVILSRFEFNP